MIKLPALFFQIFAMLFFFSGCSSENTHTLKITASSVPHAHILEQVKPILKRQGIELIIIVSDDYNTPNRSLADKEVDANFFQHLPFLDEQIKQFHYPIKSLVKVEIEPMGIYSKKIHSLSELKDNAIIAIPNDPTNEARALSLLEKQGMIKLDRLNHLQATILNIRENKRNFKFIEIDAAMLPRSLEDVDIAAINTNYAFEANLFPAKDALVMEDVDSPYANVIAIRIEDENQPKILALKAAITSDELRTFILTEYKGAILPLF